MEMMINNGIIETTAVVKESKVPDHWSSTVFKKYKWKYNSRRFRYGAENFR